MADWVWRRRNIRKKSSQSDNDNQEVRNLPKNPYSRKIWKNESLWWELNCYREYMRSWAITEPTAKPPQHLLHLSKRTVDSELAKWAPLIERIWSGNKQVHQIEDFFLSTDIAFWPIHTLIMERYDYKSKTIEFELRPCPKRHPTIVDSARTNCRYCTIRQTTSMFPKKSQV